IKPYFTIDKHTKVRLKDEFYREIIYEVFGNVLVHGLGDASTSVVELGQGKISGLPAVIVSNAVADGPNQRQIQASDWTEWRRASPTGLSFVSNALHATNAGRLFYRNPMTAERRERCFSVGLMLRGLEFLPPAQ